MQPSGPPVLTKRRHESRATRSRPPFATPMRISGPEAARAVPAAPYAPSVPKASTLLQKQLPCLSLGRAVPCRAHSCGYLALWRGNLDAGAVRECCGSGIAGTSCCAPQRISGPRALSARNLIRISVIAQRPQAESRRSHCVDCYGGARAHPGW